MKRIVLELTDRCNLRCRHCFAGRHGGKGLLSSGIFARILSEALSLGYTELALTGGEPTLHPQFSHFLSQAASAGYRVGFVTNGWSFPQQYRHVLALRSALTFVTFSLDGASADTHDDIRGSGSYRRVLQAMSVCVATHIPFTANMVLTQANHHELEDLAALCEALGAQGLRFGHFIEAGQPDASRLALDADERRAIEERIRALDGRFRMPVGIAPGYFTKVLFPCAPLNDEEINIDWRGYVSRCCHLSGPAWGQPTEPTGTLRDASLGELVEKVVEDSNRLRADKTARKKTDALSSEDLWPCHYCVRQASSRPYLVAPATGRQTIRPLQRKPA